MRCYAKIYEHPDFVADSEDFSLFSTILLVLLLAVVGAFLILTMTCFVFWDDCKACELPQDDLAYILYTDLLDSKCSI